MQDDNYEMMDLGRPRRPFLDRLAKIAADCLGAPIALITVTIGKQLRVAGSFGIHIAPRQPSRHANGFGESDQFEFIKNVSRIKGIKEHPLIGAAPFVRKVLRVPVPKISRHWDAALIIAEPSAKWPIDVKATAILGEIAQLIADEMKFASEQPILNPTGGEVCRASAPAGFDEPSLVNCDIAGNFLLQTLNTKTVIRARGDISYLTLRSWSSPIKSHQIEALKIVKAHPQPAFVDKVAEEIVRSLGRLMSVRSLSAIAPVPGGHAKTDKAFSQVLAERLASQLGLPCVAALSQARRPGTSHPRKNSRLPEPTLDTSDRLGSVLLVDDVATSGRHVELSVKTLLRIADHVSAVAWIGAK